MKNSDFVELIPEMIVSRSLQSWSLLVYCYISYSYKLQFFTARVSSHLLWVAHATCTEQTLVKRNICWNNFKTILLERKRLTLIRLTYEWSNLHIESISAEKSQPLTSASRRIFVRIQHMIERRLFCQNLQIPELVTCHWKSIKATVCIWLFRSVSLTSYVGHLFCLFSFFLSAC